MRDGSASLQRLAAEATAAIKPSPQPCKGRANSDTWWNYPPRKAAMIAWVTGILSKQTR